MTNRSFLFWNIGKLTRLESLTELVAATSADVVMLAENSFDVDHVCLELSQATDQTYRCVRSTEYRCVVLTTIRHADVQAVAVDINKRFTIYRLFYRATDILLAVAHLRSKMHGNESSDQSLQVTHFADEILRMEEKFDHQRTIVVGDLNMNPFEIGLTGARCLHGVPTKGIAQKRSRTIESREYSFFYNPMWSCFGDESPGPPGTYYDSRANQDVCFWNIFDQVLVRPDLIDGFTGPTIHDSIGEIELIRPSGKLNTGDGSDHLPISFSIEMQ